MCNPILTRDPSLGIGINCLIDAANKNDRFKFLNDDAVPAGDLDNPIHPIFNDSNFRERTEHLEQALRLASLFLQYDSCLEFFVPLVYGKHHTERGSQKLFLSDPVSTKSAAELKPYFHGIRQALHCLAHCITYRWVDNTNRKRTWGRTILDLRQPTHTPQCTNAFQFKRSARIELDQKMRMFYEDKRDGYAARSRCDQFRHDFVVAVTLTHEVVHALGVMRRGHTNEPYIRLDHVAGPEWGYAWENFMFGAVFNPQDRKKLGTHILSRKIWATSETFWHAGGKEYCPVPMSWIAQWFRKSTWELIEKDGPLAIEPSTIHVKITSSSKLLLHNKRTRWLVQSYAPETRDDIQQLRDQAERINWEDKMNWALSTSACKEVLTTIWEFVDSKSLQESNVRIPSRVPNKYNFMSVAAAPGNKPSAKSGSEKSSTSRNSSSSDTNGSSSQRKRPRDGDDSDRPTKAVKRTLRPR